jgi:hypothetical protein
VFTPAAQQKYLAYYSSCAFYKNEWLKSEYAKTGSAEAADVVECYNSLRDATKMYLGNKVVEQIQKDATAIGKQIEIKVLIPASYNNPGEYYMVGCSYDDSLKTVSCAFRRTGAYDYYSESYPLKMTSSNWEKLTCVNTIEVKYQKKKGGKYTTKKYDTQPKGQIGRSHIETVCTVSPNAKIYVRYGRTVGDTTVYSDWVRLTKGVFKESDSEYWIQTKQTYGEYVVFNLTSQGVKLGSTWKTYKAYLKNLSKYRDPLSKKKYKKLVKYAKKRAQVIDTSFDYLTETERKPEKMEVRNYDGTVIDSKK